MSNLQDFIDMGGYAGFIWPTYLVAAVVLVLLWLLSMRDWRRSEAALSALQRDRSAAGGSETSAKKEPA